MDKKHQSQSFSEFIASLGGALYLRESTLIGRRPGKTKNKQSNGRVIPGIVPFSKSTLWRKVKASEFPAPVKLTERVTAWNAADVWSWLQSRPSVGAGNV